MAYYCTANISAASKLVSATGPETSVYAVAISSSTYTFIRWDIQCDYCGDILSSFGASQIYVNLETYYSNDHPGPFHLIAIYNSGAPSTIKIRVNSPCCYREDRLSLSSKTQLYYWSGGVQYYCPDYYMSSPSKERVKYFFPQWTTWDPYIVSISSSESRTFRVSITCAIRVGYRIKGFDFVCQASGAHEDLFYYTYTKFENTYVLDVTMVRYVPGYTGTYDLYIGVVYEYTGEVGLTVKALPSNYGIVRVEGTGSWGYVETGAKILIEHLEQMEAWPYNLGPHFDLNVTAIDGVVKFSKWSDGGARSHLFTITEYGQTLTAYFSEGLLIFDQNEGNQLIYDQSRMALMYENSDALTDVNGGASALTP